MNKKLLCLTSGGDAPGMNAAIRAVVRSGHSYGLQVFASLYGYRGLLEQTLIPLGPESVANIIQCGGTILKSDRCDEFRQKSVRDACREFLAKEQIDFLVVIGGDGSFRGAYLLETEGGPKTMGIPATIDNDIIGTEYTIGYDTARNTALDAIDNIRDTAGSHERNFLIEVMGRQTGFLATDVGIAGGAELILIPEFPIDINEITRLLAKSKRQKLSTIIVVAEASSPGRSIAIAEELKQLTKQEFRVCILGHTQRGGRPSAFDRLMASQMGVLAVQGLLNNQSLCMVAQVQNALQYVPLSNIGIKNRQLSDKGLLDICRLLAR